MDRPMLQSFISELVKVSDLYSMSLDFIYKFKI